ncbi:MAG: stage III sporulation protein AE, partial [Lachnospiraceae bacterium]|nr:stage III sporulation protein AE [Lachnospiraceae bacterium]
LAKQETGITFSQLTGLIAENGVMGSLREIGDYVLQSLIGEIRTNRQTMIHILVLVLLFCVLQNFLELTDNSYISELCYMLTYLVMMLLLLKSFSVTAQIVRDMLDTVTGFMRMLLPAYLGVMVFAGSAMSAMSFYELTFFILYGIEMIMTYFLLPLISVYVLFQLANYTLKDEVFSKTADLIHDLFGWGAKIILTLVVGLNVVQSMIAPAVDYASRTTLTKSLGLIPGIGGAASAIGDILIGSGMVIKNSVGVAAIFLLLFLTLVPFIKVLIITFLYKCMAAFLEPIADKRIAKAMAGMATGGGMLMRMITTTVFMIFITIAMISATSSFMT